MKGTVAPISLAQEEVAEGELITIVGHGHNEDWGGGMGGERRFHRTRVVKLEAGDTSRALFEQQDRNRYKGESGGPCLRETEQGPVLVGISSRSLGEEPAFIRTQAYRDWLQEHLQLAVQPGAAVLQNAP
jgi:hypothetical protein